MFEPEHASIYGSHAQHLAFGIQPNNLNIKLNVNALILILKVLNFWKFTSYCSFKPLWSGMGEVVAARTSQTLHSPSPPTVHQLSRLAL